MKAKIMLAPLILGLCACSRVDHASNASTSQHSQITSSSFQPVEPQPVDLSPILSADELPQIEKDSEQSSHPSSTAHDETHPSVDYSQYSSVDQVIEDLIQEYGFDRSNLEIAYTNLITGEEYFLNPDFPIHAASTNKVGTSVMFVDLINQGLLDWSTPIPFSESYYEEGGGEITNGEIQDSYPLNTLIYNMLVFSDNTAWNTLINYYYSNYGDFQSNLIERSGISEVSEELYQLNYGTARMLNAYLLIIAKDPSYQQLVDYMMQAQPGQRFRLYVDEGMATKYGQYEEGYHDTGIFYENGQAVYTLVLMTHGLGMEDYFMGELNLRVNEWYHYQTQIKP